jgi:chemotaxis protein histidine kinase CheA
LHKIGPQLVVEDQLGIFLKLDTAETLHSVLVHLLTNCIDHGIEVPEQRLRKGKHEQGSIHVSVKSLNSSWIQICVGDDGAGLALPKLQQMGLEKGLLSSPSDPQAIAETIFASGVSTQDQVSELSGRGVGMDAVRELLQQMEGKISIRFRSPQPRADQFEPFDFVIELPVSQFWFKKLTLIRGMEHIDRAS